MLPRGSPRRGAARLPRVADGSLRRWTGPVAVRLVPLADPALADHALQQRRGVGRLLAGLRAGGPLPPPAVSGG